MSAARDLARRRWWAIAALVPAIAAIVPLVLAAPGPGGVVVQPVLGAADADMRLIGTTESGGETWGYRKLPLTVAPPVVDGQPLQFGPGQEDGQLAFLRHTPATGWRYEETPLDPAGNPSRGPIPNPRSARLTRAGGGLLVGGDRFRPADNQVVILIRDPGGRFRAIPDPRRPEIVEAGEALAADNGTGRVAVAAFDRAGKTAAFFAAGGPSVERAIAFWDGEAWHREPIEVPLDAEAGMQVLGISATGADNAWLVARKAASAGRGISLFERTTDGDPRWRERSLGDSPFAKRVDVDVGLEEVEALGDAAQSITATEDGVWVDGRFNAIAESGELHTFTLYFDRGDGRVTGSWCDALRPLDSGAVCDHRLDARLSTQTGVGYRSFAWAGEGFGTRIVTNPIEPGGDGETNRGTYLRFDGTNFERMPGGGGNFRPGGAFSSVDEGWLEGLFHVTRSPEPVQMGDSWPVSARGPLTSVSPAPGSTPGDGGAQALAAGTDGSVLRYKPGEGWTREFLQSSTGAVVRSNLRGVAWPEASRAHAVGDLGAMWLWRAETGLWERDPAAPVGYEGHLMDVAFAPGSAERGYAVGKSGALLSYGKSWTQEAVPDGYGAADFTQIAFAGGQALVATSRVARDADVLVNDGGGWRIDDSAHALLRSVPGKQQLHAVAGLPDGGAVAAGRDVVLIRDSAGSPWRFSDQPLPGSMVIAAAATRDGGRVRPVVSVVRVPREEWRYPPVDEVGVFDPNQPLPLLPAYPLPADGFVLRETATGWSDEQHSAFAGSGDDRPVKSDPVLDFAVGPGGSGWAVGGWSGEQDAAYSGSSGRGAGSKADRARVQTAAVFRLGEQTAVAPGAAASPVDLPTGPARVAVGGHAACEAPCADLSLQDIRPDRSLVSALGKVAALRAQPAGPRMMLYTGGRLAQGVDGRVAPREMGRYASLMASQPVPVYPAVSATDVPAASSFRTAFGSFYAPFGAGPAAPGVDASRIPGAPAGPGARTHYAFDSAGPEGTLRVIVIDNASGSLGASNAHQNPIEDQAAWLAGTLLDAKTRGIPAIVMGSRDLNARFTPRLNVADDGDAVARILIDGGASAYFFERPEENRAYQLTAGGTSSLPAYGTGTLGYRSHVNDPSNPVKSNALFGDSGYLLAEVDIARRNPLTNQAPVNVRMIPLIDDLSIQATDGTLIRRSRPALFQGLGRRPLGGDRWRPLSTGNSDPAGSDPYIAFPPDPCLIAGCATRVEPEFQFLSSDPDIADFVRQDPNSTNLRKPFLGADDKPVSDSRSGLLCAFNAGITTVSVRAGGLSFAQQVRIQPGSVQRPCGTRPLRPDRFRRPAAVAPAAPPPAAPQGGSEPPLTFQPPPPPAVPAPTPVPSPPPPAPFVPAFLPPLEPASGLPPVPLPVAPALLRPSPPSGGFGRAFEKQREEEVAPEESQAFTRYQADDQGMPAGYLLGALVLAALAGSSIFGGPRGRPRSRPAPAYATRPRRQNR